MINKFDMQQDIERVLVSEEDIHARIREVGAQISEDYRGKCPIFSRRSQGRCAVFRRDVAGHHRSRAGGLHVRHVL